MNRNQNIFESYYEYPKEFTSVLELLMGAIFSSWFYFSNYAHKDDCFSAFWELAVFIFAKAPKFDKEWVLIIPGTNCYATICLSGSGLSTLIKNLILPISFY